MFLFLLAISDWLNFQPCNRKKEWWVKIFLGEVAVVVAPQNIRRLSLQKSQVLAIETRSYLFQNCYFFFFFHEKNKCEAVARYFDGGVDGTAICSFLFSWLGLYFLCWLLDLSRSQLRALNQKIHTAKRKEKKKFLYHLCLILKKGNVDMGEAENEGMNDEPWNWLSWVEFLNSAHQTPQSGACQARSSSACMLLI